MKFLLFNKYNTIKNLHKYLSFFNRVKPFYNID